MPSGNPPKLGINRQHQVSTRQHPRPATTNSGRPLIQEYVRYGVVDVLGLMKEGNMATWYLICHHQVESSNNTT
jgi:hypothetical protein